MEILMVQITGWAETPGVPRGEKRDISEFLDQMILGQEFVAYY